MSDEREKRKPVPVAELPAVRAIIEKGERKRKAIEAGRLYRVKHQLYGSKEVEAKDEIGAAKVYAETHNPGNAKDPEWVKRFAAECRIVKLSPVAAAA